MKSTKNKTKKNRSNNNLNNSSEEMKMKKNKQKEKMFRESFEGKIVDGAGVRAIYLSTDNYKVVNPDTTKLSIVDDKADKEDQCYKKILWYDLDNNPVFGKKAYYSTSEYSIELCPRENGTPVLKIQCFPINKFLNPINTLQGQFYTCERTELKVKDLKEMMAYIELKIMIELGISLVLDTAKITRLDIKTTIVFEKPTGPLYILDKMKNIKQIQNVKQRYDIMNGLCWSNNKQELLIYNKKENEVMSEEDRGSLYAEIRFMDSDLINDSLGKNIIEITQEKLDNLLLQLVHISFKQLESK